MEDLYEQGKVKAEKGKWKPGLGVREAQSAHGVGNVCFDNVGGGLGFVSCCRRVQVPAFCLSRYVDFQCSSGCQWYYRSLNNVGLFL